MDGHVEIIRFFQYVTGFFERLRDDGVQHDVRRRDGIPGSHHTELEFIAGEGKRRRTVPVRGVLRKIREGLHAGLQFAALYAVRGCPRADQLLQHILQLLAQEDGDDRRRCLIGSQPVVVAHIRGRLPQKIRMDVDGFQDTGQHQQELDILMGRLARLQQVDPVVGDDRPVIVLARTVHPGKWFLMEQAFHPVLAGHPL